MPSLETLQLSMANNHVTPAETAAADIAKIDINALREVEQPHVHDLGHFAISGGVEVRGFRAHDGMIRDPKTNLLRPYQGGSRLVGADFSNLTTVGDIGAEGAARLAYGMLNKRAATVALLSESDPSYTFEHVKNGGKAEFVTSVDPRSLTFEQKAEIFTEFAERAHKEGIVGSNGSHQTIIAPDMFTGDSRPGEPNLMNIYASRYHELDIQASELSGKTPDPYWKEVAAGKVIDGNEFRPDATAWGVFLAAEHARELSGALATDAPQSVKIQGSGNVGLMTAMFMSMDPKQQFNVTIMNDLESDGKIRTLKLKDESQGIHISPEIAKELIQKADKMTELAKILRQQQPELEFDIIDEDRESAKAILESDADWFLPAAGPDVLTAKTVPENGEAISRLGVIEGANNGIDDVAMERLHTAGKIVLRDRNVNTAGTFGSDDELADNRLLVNNPDSPPATYKESQDRIGSLFTDGLRQLERVSRELPEIPPHLTGTVIAVSRRALLQGIPVNNSQLKDALQSV